MLGNYDYLDQIVYFVRFKVQSGVILPIYTDKENWPTICGSEQEIAKKCITICTPYMKLVAKYSPYFTALNGPIRGCHLPVPGLYCTLHSTQYTLYTGPAPILQNSTHPHLLTRPPASPDTGRDGCEDARLRRMEAAGPGTNLLAAELAPVSL